MSKEENVIYILTNPSFPSYIKIGYASNIEKRLKELNRSECIPFAFRVYATYEVNTKLTDKKVHEIIDTLNPNLRSIDYFDGKQRIREFFAMTPEDAYELLKAMSEIHGCSDKLHKWEMEDHEKEDEETAQEIEAQTEKQTKKPFKFSMAGVKVGDIITFAKDESVKCTVVDENHVVYNGITYSLSSLGQILLGYKYNVQGPAYFKFNGRLLTELREENDRD